MHSLHFLRKHFISNSIFISYYNKNIIYRKTIRAAKQIYFTTRISKSHNDQLEYWRIVNELCQRNKLVIDSKLISDELNIRKKTNWVIAKQRHIVAFNFL